MRSILRIVLAAVALHAAIAAPAAAAPIVIGTFEWIDDPIFGPVFQLTNNSHLAPSPYDFLDPSVTVVYDDSTSEVGVFFGSGADPFVFEPGDSGFAIGPFFGTVVSATLQMVLDPVTAFTVAELLGPGPANITVEVQDPDPSVVPEPSSLLLLGSGVALWRVRRRRRP